MEGYFLLSVTLLLHFHGANAPPLGFWLSDKPLVQQELASSLAEFLLVIPTSDASLHFLRGFWSAIVREWPGLDYLR
jgi:hypothetical protein